MANAQRVLHEPCPFCGHEKLILTESRSSILSRVECWVTCTKCQAEGPSHRSPAEAMEAWNRRPGKSERRATIDFVFE